MIDLWISAVLISELECELSLKKLKDFGFDITKPIDESQRLTKEDLLSKSLGLSAVWEGTPLCLAALAGDIDLIKVLYIHSADMDTTDAHGRSPLFLAVREGRAEAVKLLIELGAKQSFGKYIIKQITATTARDTFFYRHAGPWLSGSEVSHDKTEQYLRETKYVLEV